MRGWGGGSACSSVPLDRGLNTSLTRLLGSSNITPQSSSVGEAGSIT